MRPPAAEPSTRTPGPPRPAPELDVSYKAIAQIAPILLEQQTKGNVHGFVLNKEHPSVDFDMNGYVAHVSLDSLFGNHAESGFGLIIATGPLEFLGTGEGFRVSFSAKSPGPPHVGIGSVDEGKFEDGKWVQGLRLNGDENDQGNYWRFDQRQMKVEKAIVYRFE